RERGGRTDPHPRKVTRADGEVRHYYIDTDYYVPIKVEIKRVVRGAERETETVFGDYKSVNGWYLPYSMEFGRKGSQNRQKITFSKIEANAPIAHSRFVMPGSAVPRETESVAAAAPTATPPEAAAPVVQQSNKPVTIDSETISGLGARNIGSAAMSGRIAAIDAVHEGQRLTIYIGSASGGGGESGNGGTTYKPVFDKQPVQAIGAVTGHPKEPQEVWGGTREAGR